MAIELEQNVASLVEATDKLLWDSYGSATNETKPPCRLIFPQTSKGAVRVSEQEAKQLLIGTLSDTQFSFSVETPTLRNYGFSGKGQRNAMTDLTLYSEGQRCLNMEFKAGNTSTKRVERKHINKDIQKLVFEDVNAFWFHTLKSAKSASVNTLWQTIRHELRAVVQKETVKFTAKLFTFHCCVLREAFSVQITFPVNECSCDNDWLTDLHAPAFAVKKGRLTELHKAEGWIVRRSCSDVEAVKIEVR